MSALQNGGIIVNISARTDVGMIRRGNEDCFLVADLSTGNVGLVPEVSRHRLGQKGSLLVVSDGMGGAVAGEIASDLSVKNVREELIRNTHITDVSERLRSAVEFANNAVFQYAVDNPQFTGMGATITAVLCHESKAVVAQVGDSRAYIVRNGRIKQLTKDQSLVQLLIDSHAIKPEQAYQVPNNVILQALGTRPEVVVALTSVDLCRDDYLLVCSDGLSNKVSAEEMRDAMVQSGPDLAGACRKLIELANARGGEDNITALVARFDGESLESASERSSITGSMHALTPDDLLRIGGPQFDHFQHAVSSPGHQNLRPALEDMGITLAPPAQTQPSADNNIITQVGGFAALPPEDEPPDVVIPHEMAPAPAPVAVEREITPPAMPQASVSAPLAAASAASSAPKKTSNTSKILLLVGVLMVVLGFLAVGSIAVWWFFLRTPAVP